MRRIMSFDPSITIGNILTILALAGSVLLFMYRLEGKLVILHNTQNMFKDQLNKIDNELEKLSQVTIEMARQDERISAQDMRLNMIAQKIDMCTVKLETRRQRARKGSQD